MRTENGTRNVRTICIGTKVRLLDLEKLNVLVRESFGRDDIEVKNVGRAYVEGVDYLDKDSGTKVHSLLIDEEFIGRDSETVNMIISDLNKKGFSCNLFKDIPIYEIKGKGIISVFPVTYVDIDEDDIKKCLTDEETNLFEYTKKRYGYNHRIDNNEYNILKVIHHNKENLLEELEEVVEMEEWER